ncbi:hypothetical protein Zm00014a_010850 [Zea mays]|nr:hypothetical protein Zm00014a_010850 [Zea mays]
MWILLF